MSKTNLSQLSRRNRPKTRTRRLIGWVDPGRFAIASLTAILLAILLAFHFLPDRVSVNIGERSPVEIHATRGVAFVDTDATLRKRQDAALRVPSAYDHDPIAVAQASSVVSDTFDTISRIRTTPPDISTQRRIDTAVHEFGTLFTPDEIKFLVTCKPAQLSRLLTAARRLVEASMTRVIRSDTNDLVHVKADFVEGTRAAVTSVTEQTILQAVGSKALRSTYRVNELKSRQARDAAMRSHTPVTGEVKMGDLIVRQGEIFTQLHYDQCLALGLISPRIDASSLASIFALSLAMVLLVGIYIRTHFLDIYNNYGLLVLLSSVVIASVLGLKIFGQMLGIPLSLVQVGYFGLMMVVAAGMIITLLLNSQLAIVITALLSVLSGLIMNHELRFAVMTLMSSLVGIFSVTNIRARGHLVRATVAIAAMSIGMVWILGGLQGDTQSEMAAGSAWAVVSAAFAVGIFWFAVTVLERPFGILTHAWLLELSASDHPLLRELCVTAPGTYAHSIMVGNLAEAAAEAIKADALFCRVASYYHDVGKMRRPHCFVENQIGDNIHDSLNPSLSALIIASHVRDGVEIATSHKLPAQIKAIISEHHGTTLIRYFYHQALANSQEAKPDPILEQHFRYEGPKPQRKESGIIMLADTVEAAARCLDKPSPSRIESLVESLIHEKMTDGQLDECDLTFRDIDQIRSAFVRLLNAMLHSRIDYPDMVRTDEGIVVELPESAVGA
ncbi:MAG: HDIG domain-containing metalloprotein [Chthonomonadales bacterium]